MQHFYYLGKDNDDSDDDEQPGWHTELKTTYDYAYEYDATQPHAPSRIGDLLYGYDSNGNITETYNLSPSGRKIQKRRVLWDPENRIRAISDRYDLRGTFHYI